MRRIPDPQDLVIAVTSYVCDKCGAHPGEECRNLRTGGWNVRPHHERLQSLWAARKDAWQGEFKAAMAWPCDRCGAQPGETCHNLATGAEMSPHRERRLSAFDPTEVPESERTYIRER